MRSLSYERFVSTTLPPPPAFMLLLVVVVWSRVRLGVVARLVTDVFRLSELFKLCMELTLLVRLSFVVCCCCCCGVVGVGSLSPVFMSKLLVVELSAFSLLQMSELRADSDPIAFVPALVMWKNQLISNNFRVFYFPCCGKALCRLTCVNGYNCANISSFLFNF